MLEAERLSGIATRLLGQIPPDIDFPVCQYRPTACFCVLEVIGEAANPGE